MKLELAKTAGFCYGVRRAVELAEQTAAAGLPCVMLGALIHNRHVTERLDREGVREIHSLDEAPGRDRGNPPFPWRSPRCPSSLDRTWKPDYRCGLPQRIQNPPDRRAGGNGRTYCGDHWKPGSPGGDCHCRLVSIPGGSQRARRKLKLGWRTTQNTTKSPCLWYPRPHPPRCFGRLAWKK